MFSVNDQVYAFRDFMMFGDILEHISDQGARNIIWIHNAAYEFQFLLNIFKSKKWTVEKMVSRDLRKPISWYIPEINTEFRCSYMLTNMSLDIAAKAYTKVEKKKGQLDYSKVRSSKTHLTDQELEYCEYDCLCLYHIIEHYRDKYKGVVASIPLTSTGEVRKKLKDRVDYYYIRKMQSLVPERKMYLIEMLAFSGGYTHTNMLNANKTFRATDGYRISGYDIASSYPIEFFRKLPDEPFRWCPVSEYKAKDCFAYLVHVKFTDLKCKYYNTYIQRSKMMNQHIITATYDNGRLQSCMGDFEMYITDQDFELIKKMYTGTYQIMECWKAHKGYIDKRILKFILEMYKNKTVLKGATDTLTQNIYKQSKAYINSLYGCTCSNVLKQSSNYIDGEWHRYAFSDSFIDSKIEEARKSFSTLFQYSSGLYITAAARCKLLECVLEMDKDVIYMDTDSIKYIGDHNDVFERFNERVMELYRQVNAFYPDIKIEDFMPVDKKGVQHPIGFFECENDGDIEEFRALGAKKYAYRDSSGLHITLAGVTKKGVVALQDNIDNFKNGFIFDYDTSGKLIHLYNDEQPRITFEDIDGNVTTSDLKYGVVLYPTTYRIGQTIEYLTLLSCRMVEEYEIEY